METVVCDITAFDYWRIPPLVHLLLAGEGDDVALRKITSSDQLQALRAEVVAGLPLCARYLGTNSHTRTMGRVAKQLLPIVPLLAAGHEDAVDVLAGRHCKCYESDLLRTHLWSRNLPVGSTLELYEDVRIISPELLMLCLAGRASLAHTVMMASELCGSFAVYDPPAPIRAFLQRILDSGKKIPVVQGWKPYIDASGKLGTLWSRPPLTSPGKLTSFAADSDLKKGASRLVRAASLVKEGAASPFEVQTAVLLGFPRRMGGYGIGGFVANGKVPLNVGGKALSLKSCCYCDLFWEEQGIDVECQSAMVHQNADSFLSDSERTTALKGMGIDVLPLTFDQLKDAGRFDCFVNVLANSLGLSLRPRTEAMMEAASRLRCEVLIDWEFVHHV